MGFIEMGKEFGDVKEIPLAPDAEYDLKIVDAEEPAGKSYILWAIDFEGEDYKRFNHFMNLPDKVRDAKTDEDKGRDPGTTSRNKQIYIKRFLEAFSIPYEKNGFDPKDGLGQTARLPVSQSMSQKGMRNQDLVLPEIPGEG